MALLTGGLLLTFAVGFAGVFWQWRRAEAKSVEARNNAVDADQQRAEAEANSRLGLEAINRFFKRVNEEQLLSQPGNQAQRRQILEDGLRYYRRFLDEVAAHDDARDAQGEAFHG